MIQEIANINASGQSSGSFATDEFDIVDEISTISMTKHDHRQILEELENFAEEEEDSGIEL